MGEHTVIEIHETDSLSINVTVTESDGSAFDLTGCTNEAVCQMRSRDPIAASVSVTNAAGGLLTASIPAGAFSGLPGKYSLQLRVTSGADLQTVLEEYFTVKESAPSAV